MRTLRSVAWYEGVLAVLVATCGVVAIVGVVFAFVGVPARTLGESVMHGGLRLVAPSPAALAVLPLAVAAAWGAVVGRHRVVWAAVVLLVLVGVAFRVSFGGYVLWLALVLALEQAALHGLDHHLTSSTGGPPPPP